MRLGLLFGGTLAALLAWGCGGSSGMPTSGGTTSTTTGSGPAPGAVSIAEYSFSPDTISVKAGAEITWTNNGTIAHTATADSGAFDSGQIAAPTGGGTYGGGSAAGSFTFKFATAGTFAYHCANHPTQMKGVVIVTP